jgi:phosphoglycolate phosphatase
MKYKAVIFDLDGTLLDTILDITITMNEALKRYNYPTFTVEDYKYFVGKGVDNLIKQVIKAASLDEDAYLKLKTAYYEIYETQATINTKAYTNIPELVNELKKKGLSVNVLSNKPHSQTVDVINHYFGLASFTLVYGKKKEFPPKPNPESALDLIDKLGINSEEVLYIGDTETDIQTAKNAKFKSVGVLWGFRKAIELIDAGADYLVSDPLEIIKLIE